MNSANDGGSLSPTIDDSTPTTVQLLARYDQPGPRYTSYPTAVEFDERLTEGDYLERLRKADALADEPLSVYMHLPFCRERCLYCGCHVVRTHHREIAEKYLDYLIREIDLLADHLPHRRNVSQLHWGGGTPTFHSSDSLERLFDAFAKRFSLTADSEVAVEVDPRVTTMEQIHTLRRLGFNRISVGVQDFTPLVQETVKRIQSYEVTEALINRARAEGFLSVNIDLIYGLPHQNLRSFADTLARVVSLRPDRVAVYSFAHVPWLKGHQRLLPKDALPGPGTKLELLALTIDRFTEAGYRQIGMDHFALPADELSRAVERRTLNRNFMGYTVQSARDVVGVGVSSIGDIQNAYVQNVKKLSEYFAALDRDHFPVERGYALDADDVVRRYVITRLMCNFHLDRREVEDRFGIDFGRYFAEALAELTGEDSPARHGLVTVGADAIDVTPLGRFFVRNVAMAFDRHLKRHRDERTPTFSRTV